MFKKLICGIALLSLTACGGDNIPYRHSHDYDTVLMHAPNISTYPTKATAVMVGAFGDKERQYDYEYFIEENASDIIAESLRKKGYHVSIVRKRDLSDKKSYREFDAVYERFVEEKNRVFTEENSSQKVYAFDIKTNLGKATSELKNNGVTAPIKDTSQFFFFVGGIVFLSVLINSSTNLSECKAK